MSDLSQNAKALRNAKFVFANVMSRASWLTCERFERMTSLDFLPIKGDARGEGLGLRLVRRLVESHGGRLEIEPAARGTTLRLVFDVQEEVRWAARL